MKSLRQSINEAMIGLDSYRILCKDFASKISSLSKDVKVEVGKMNHRDVEENLMYISASIPENEFMLYKDTFGKAFEDILKKTCKIIGLPYNRFNSEIGGYENALDGFLSGVGETSTSLYIYSDSDYKDMYDKEMINDEDCLQLVANCFGFFAVADAVNGTDHLPEAEKTCIDFVNTVKSTKEKRLHRNW